MLNVGFEQMIKGLRNPLTSLFIVGVASAAAWLLEVHLRGWAGLQWINYFHLAVPCGTLLFLLWLNVHCGIASLPRRLTYLILVAVFAVGAYLVAGWSLCWHFGGIRVWMPFDEWPLTYRLSLFSIYLIFPAIPVTFLLLSRCFGVRFRKLGIVVGMAIYLLAIPLAMLIIAVVGHRGQADSIHAIKTGFCIPFLMAGLGLPFVFRKDEEIQPDALLGSPCPRLSSPLAYGNERTE
jgi:hypothetical protein